MWEHFMCLPGGFLCGFSLPYELICSCGGFGNVCFTQWLLVSVRWLNTSGTLLFNYFLDKYYMVCIWQSYLWSWVFFPHMATSVLMQFRVVVVKQMIIPVCWWYGRSICKVRRQLWELSSAEVRRIDLLLMAREKAVGLHRGHKKYRLL